MKKSVFLLTTVFVVTFANAQKISDKDVPATVKSAFEKQYSTVKKVKWEKENANYEAGFESNETECSVLMDASGNIVETEVAITINKLPAKVKEYVSKNYPGQKIKEAAKITKADGEINYETEVKGMDVIFDAAGNFIRENKN
jgi:hypothetical protein